MKNITNPIRYTDDLYDILDDIEDKISDKLMRLENDISLANDMLGIELLDISRHDWSFNAKIGGKFSAIKVGYMIRKFFPDQFSEIDIKNFTEKYNTLKNKKRKAPAKSHGGSTLIEVPEFKYNPKDVRATFISLVTETYPHPHEDEVYPLISGAGLTKDKFGNYYKIIGKSTTMFTCHLDTADRKKSKVVLYSKKIDSQEHIVSDGTTILGADDKSGVAVLLYMIAHNVPGVYYFFIGEERGGIGSNKVSKEFDSFEHLKGIKKCVSFDRRNYYSIITSQMFSECCSDEFANSLANEYSKNGMKFKLDDTGIYTDSASFIDQIPECTNISVGYFDEHTFRESQNITFLERLAKASVGVDWDNLTVKRKIGFSDIFLSYFKEFLEDFRSCAFNLDVKLASAYGSEFIKIDMDESDIELVQDDFLNLSELFNIHNLDPYLTFDDSIIRVDLVVEPYFKKYYDIYSTDSDLDMSYESLHSLDGPKSFKDDVEELCYWVEKMFLTNNLDVSVQSDEYDLNVYLFLKKKEKISTFLKAFDVVARVKEEMLTKYSAEVELYESKDGNPILKFAFNWDEGSSDTEDDDDDYEEEEEGGYSLEDKFDDSAPF